MYPYHHTSATKPRAFSPGRAKHVPSSRLGSLQTRRGDIETAINGRINTAQQAVRLAEASDSCQAMGLPNPGSLQNMAPYNSKGPPRPAQGLPRSWIGQKLVLPKTMAPPNPSYAQTISGQAMAPQEARIPAAGRPAGRRRQSSPLVGLGRPTVNCSFHRCAGAAGGQLAKSAHSDGADVVRRVVTPPGGPDRIAPLLTQI